MTNCYFPLKQQQNTKQPFQQHPQPQQQQIQQLTPQQQQQQQQQAMQQPQQIIKRHQFQIPNNMPFSMQNQPSVAALLSNMAKNSQVN